jgi:IS5 family transposase
VPKPDKNISRGKRKKHSKRAAIEPVIGHLKADYRLCRNFLKGILGDLMNVILAAAAMNFKRVMNLWRTEANGCWKLIDILYMLVLKLLLPEKLKMTF